MEHGNRQDLPHNGGGMPLPAVDVGTARPCWHSCGGPVGGGWLHLRAAAARERGALLGVRHG